MADEEVIEAIMDWIDTAVIAEMIVEHLKDSGETPTVDRCKEVWLATLGNLGGGVGLAV